MRDVVSAYIERRGAKRELLLVRKGPWWQFPGGKRECGETLHEALARELKEEVGMWLAHAVPKTREDVCAAPSGETYRFHLFRCTEVIRGVAFVPAGDSVVECLWATAPLALSVTAHTRLVLRAVGW